MFHWYGSPLAAAMMALAPGMRERAVRFVPPRWQACGQRLGI